jgi:DNA-binding CsgD family transcriptional regulator
MNDVIPELVRSIRSAALNPDRWTDVFSRLLLDAGDRELELAFYRVHGRSSPEAMSISMAWPAPAEVQPAISEGAAKGSLVAEFLLDGEIYGIKVRCPSCDACPVCENVREVRDEVALSASFSRALLSAKLLTSYLRSILDELPDPAFFLDHGGTVAWQNRAAGAEEWNEAFDAAPGKPFVLNDAAAQAAFKLALADAWKEAGAPAKSINFVQAKTGASGLAILKAIEPALPFSSPWVRLFQDKPQAVAVLRNKSSKAQLSPLALRQFYSLTAKEAELAVALVQGETLRDYASRTEVAFETARWHSKKLMQKMNCRSQQEILQALLYTNAVFSVLK